MNDVRERAQRPRMGRAAPWVWGTLAAAGALLALAPSLAPPDAVPWARGLGGLLLAVAVAIALLHRRAARRARARRAAAEHSEVRASTHPPASPPDHWSEAVLGSLSAARFEALAERLLQHGGQRVHRRPGGATPGLWLHLHAAGATGRPDAVALCRRVDGGTVKVAEVDALAQAMARQGIARGLFVAPARFTAEARRFASAHGIACVDGAGLLQRIERLTPVQQQELLELAWAGPAQAA